MLAHQILGIRADATVREIRSAYHRLAKRCHPDCGGDAGKFVRLSQAYQELIHRGTLGGSTRPSVCPGSSGCSIASVVRSGRQHTGPVPRTRPTAPAGPPAPSASATPVRQPQSQGVRGSLVFTLYCAGAITLKVLCDGIGFGTTAALFVLNAGLLGGAAALAAVAGASNAAHGRRIYAAVITTLTLSFFAGSAGQSLRTLLEH